MGNICGDGALRRPTTRRGWNPIVRTWLPFLVLATLCLCVQFLLLPVLLSRSTPWDAKLSLERLDSLRADLHKCARSRASPVNYVFPVSASRQNPRWHPTPGRASNILLQNATLFDGESWLDQPVDILLSDGVVRSITGGGDTSRHPELDDHATIWALHGKYVTPGLVDMHSHHYISPWPVLAATQDDNEVHQTSGPLTPFLQVLHGLKPYDRAAPLIAAGGVTSSLVLPGSANIMGGEAVLVKNALRTGPHAEEVVEEILLEYGVPENERRRFMKMACGENPKGIYSHTRMGNAWVLRQHLERAQKLREEQDSWCLAASAAYEGGRVSEMAQLVEKGLPGDLELESTVALLRGQVGVHIHCYETEDIEMMLHHGQEFGFDIQAFHHALDGWKIPHMLKEKAENITIATFSEFGLYKKEAYQVNLWAGKILADHGVAVAYKSDHCVQELYARHLLFQAATAHSFHLPENLALQAVTSVPSKSLKVDHRVGYARPGYDADIVVWDSHPLSVGATPLQVYIDGKATLDEDIVRESMAKVQSKTQAEQKPNMRPKPAPESRARFCDQAIRAGEKITITGITRSYLDNSSYVEGTSRNFTMVLDDGQVACFGSHSHCASAGQGGPTIQLANGHVLPGLTAVTVGLGLTGITFDDTTGDGGVSTTADPMDPSQVVYAKYGVHLDGKAFARARIGGITRAITPPLNNGGLVGGVSVGFSTIANLSMPSTGVFHDDIALHFHVGQNAKASPLTPTISSAVKTLRTILSENSDKDNVYGRVANGTLPLMAHADNRYDILQLIAIKSDYPAVNLIIMEGSEAPLVAKELAAAKVPVIFTASRGGPDAWERKDMLDGPPLTRSGASVLAEAGVQFGLAIPGFSDSHLHNLLIEASWAAKYAGLSDWDAISLVSHNLDQILDLNVHVDVAGPDLVVYEGNPLEFGASPVLMVDARERRVGACWPEAE